VKLSVNGVSVGEAQFSSIYAGGETLDVGSDLGSPVSPEYKSPYRFTGKISEVRISRDRIKPPEPVRMLCRAFKSSAGPVHLMLLAAS
jgi:hypothetical protein